MSGVPFGWRRRLPSENFLWHCPTIRAASRFTQRCCRECALIGKILCHATKSQLYNSDLKFQLLRCGGGANLLSRDMASSDRVGGPWAGSAEPGPGGRLLLRECAGRLPCSERGGLLLHGGAGHKTAAGHCPALRATPPHHPPSVLQRRQLACQRR